MSAVSAITAHIGASNLVAISSSQRGNAPRMICSAHFMNIPRPRLSSKLGNCTDFCVESPPILNSCPPSKIIAFPFHTFQATLPSLVLQRL